jgi:hypothetical protein
LLKSSAIGLVELQVCNLFSSLNFLLILPFAKRAPLLSYQLIKYDAVMFEEDMIYLMLPQSQNRCLRLNGMSFNKSRKSK